MDGPKVESALSGCKSILWWLTTASGRCNVPFLYSQEEEGFCTFLSICMLEHGCFA